MTSLGEDLAGQPVVGEKTARSSGSGREGRGHSVVGAADPLRSLSGDAAYIAGVVKGIRGKVILVGHRVAIEDTAVDADRRTR